MYVYICICMYECVYIYILGFRVLYIYTHETSTQDLHRVVLYHLSVYKPSSISLS